MSRLQTSCENARRTGRKLLIPYLVAGDPDLPTSLAVMRSLVARGADILELGIPFSDPASDGPVIQRGVERALAGGTTLQDTLQLVQSFREDDQDTPVVLMGYLNPIEIMGYQHFVSAASTAGVDGVLIVDMPPAESTSLHDKLRAADIDTIFLVAPTTSAARVEAITAYTSGYLYYVSLKGVTGATLTDPAAVARKLTLLRRHTALPIVVGFGIKDADSAVAMAKVADGVVIGSALVAKIAGLAALAHRDGQVDAGRIDTVTELIGLARHALDNIQ